jgi:16S rRNA (guanine527-N7)-methyltransferase
VTDGGRPAAGAGPDGALFEVLGEARDLGLLGPGPLDPQVAHARGFARAVADSPTAPHHPGRVLDLGSGGGLPGLVLAFAWPGTRFTLLDAGRRRVAFLERAVERCGLDGRVTVVLGRAEEVGRDPEHRGAYDLVVARSFGPPAVTAECAAPFLRVGGALVVSDRPGEEAPGERWRGPDLAALGMGEPVAVRAEFGFLVVAQELPCPGRFPRRVGVPAKRPLF